MASGKVKTESKGRRDDKKSENWNSTLSKVCDTYLNNHVCKESLTFLENCSVPIRKITSAGSAWHHDQHQQMHRKISGIHCKSRIKDYNEPL